MVNHHKRVSIFQRFQKQANRAQDWLPIYTVYTGMDKLVCTPASNSLIACPGGTVSRLYRHIRQAAIPALVVLGTAVF